MNATLQQLGIDQMAVEDRLDLIGMIWDSIPEIGASQVLPDWHRQELEQRCSAADANPNAAIPWELVKARLNSAP